MTFILVDDEKRCNFCVYWTGMRKSGEEFIYVDLDSAEWGMCLHPEERCSNLQHRMYFHTAVRTGKALT